MSKTGRRFLIPSLLATGLNIYDPAQAAFTRATTTGADDPNAGKLFRIFTQDHSVTLASHSSHSSHASHSSGGYGGGGHASHMSHTSHRSSSGSYDDGDDYGTAPSSTPSYTPSYTPPPPTPPPAPASLFGSQKATPPKVNDALPALSGRTQRFAAIVRRAQIALLGQGDYKGPINGVVGPSTRAGIRRFQSSRSLTVTGTLTPQTLDALMVSSE